MDIDTNQTAAAVSWMRAQHAAAALGQALGHQAQKFACAESCTGGLLAAAMTSVPGSSAWFERGLVTYSNEAKVQLLRVNRDTLERFGAVSEETAMEMASGVLAAVPDVNVSISTTGIAGPTGATPGKPVGMVCLGFAQRTGDGVVTRALTQVFPGARDQIRHEAVVYALTTALEVFGMRSV